MSKKVPVVSAVGCIDNEGNKQTPVVLHRAIFGSLDRFMAYYLEETKGYLPVWLAPKQVEVVPVNIQYHEEYSREIFEALKAASSFIRRRLSQSVKLREIPKLIFELDDGIEYSDRETFEAIVRGY